jgi:hypothetical protein
MKKLTIYTIGVMMILLNAVALHAENELRTSLPDNSIEATKPIENVEATETDNLIERIEYINEMDKSDLKSSEKRELRKEVRSIQKELVQRGTYIYISGTALIIILLLIILL